MTFNVLCSFCADPLYDSWAERLDYFPDLFARHDPDLMGLQELVKASEVDTLLAATPGYGAIYWSSASSSYPDATLLYRSERFDVEEQGSYWLSPTPDVANSTGFAAPQLARLVVWARLVDHVDGESVFVASTHFDNNSPSQALSAPLVLERTAPEADEHPVIVVGDFNSQPADTAYQTLVEGDGKQGFHLQNAQDLAEDWGVDSNQSPTPSYDLAERIDHIFVAGKSVDWTVPKWTADLHVYGTKDRYPSDHRAIIAELER